MTEEEDAMDIIATLSLINLSMTTSIAHDTLKLLADDIAKITTFVTKSTILHLHNKFVFLQNGNTHQNYPDVISDGFCDFLKCI